MSSQDRRDDSCAMCQSMDSLEQSGGDGFALARTQTGYVNFFYGQYYKGHTLFLARDHVAELHELAPEVRTLHLEEMARVAEAVFRLNKPRKMNYAALGNIAPHLHWALVPRHADDPHPALSPWEDEGFWAAVKDVDHKTLPDPDYVAALLAEIRNAGVVVEREFRVGPAVESGTPADG